jgi:catechol 2,3-dioxygenase-like lactoylglutathione lyase family enzyme
MESGMLSHVILGTNDVVTAVEFYDAVLATIGIGRRFLDASGAGYGTLDETGIDTFWLTKPIDGHPATVGNGTNVAFVAPSREAVRDFHDRGLELGGTSEGEPGIREEAHPNFYAAYLRDPDGNKIVAICHARED